MTKYEVEDCSVCVDFSKRKQLKKALIGAAAVGVGVVGLSGMANADIIFRSGSTETSLSNLSSGGVNGTNICPNNVYANYCVTAGYNVCADYDICAGCNIYSGLCITAYDDILSTCGDVCACNGAVRACNYYVLPGNNVGVTQNVVISGTTLHFVKGIFTGIN